MKFNKYQKQFIKNLKSGKFKKGTGSLFGFNPKTCEEEYCVLGVAAISVAQVSKGKLREDALEELSQENSHIQNDTVVDALELRTGAGDLYFGDNFGDNAPPKDLEKLPDELTGINDDTDLSFKQIAKLIEKYPHVFFEE